MARRARSRLGSRATELYARISPRLAGRPGTAHATRADAWLVRRFGRSVLGRALGVSVLVLRTIGRRSGEPREAPMFFVPHRDGYAVVASNAGSRRPPAWWLNLEAEPDAEALIDGSWRPVRARRATDDEARELWPRLVEVYEGYEHYRRIAPRELPVVVLEPR